MLNHRESPLGWPFLEVDAAALRDDVQLDDATRRMQIDDAVRAASAPEAAASAAGAAPPAAGGGESFLQGRRSGLV